MKNTASTVPINPMFDLPYILICILVFPFHITATDFHTDNASSNSTDSCSSYGSCNECTSSSIACHWCEFDNKCHTIGSIYGCLFGTDCLSIDQCKREEPQWVGFPNLTLLIMALFGIASFLLVAILGCCIVKPRQRYVNIISRRSNRGVMGTNNENTTSTQFINHGEQINLLSYGTIIQSRDSSSRRISTAIHREHPIQRLLSAILVSLGVMSIISIIPKSPQINFCTQKVQWNSILSSFIDLSPTASFQILLSIYNPNPYNVFIPLASGIFYHDGLEFGMYELQPVIVKGLSITDDLVTLTFDPKQSEAFDIVEEFWLGSFNMTIETILHVVFFPNHLRNISLNIDFNSSIQNLGIVSSPSDSSDQLQDSAYVNIDVDSNGIHFDSGIDLGDLNEDDMDRHLCACPAF